MYNTILLAAALQRWERYSAHALAARDMAAFIAGSTSKRLHVFSAYDYDYMQVTQVPPRIAGEVMDEHRRRTDKTMEQKMAAFIAPLKEEGLEVTEILQVGNPRETIVQVARDIEADVLIIGSHSKRGILDIALGGTAQSVSRRAPCTVVLVSLKT